MNKKEIIMFKRLKEAFNVYCDMIIRHGKGRADTLVGSFYIGTVILCSFACEVGLKALLSSESKSSRGHYLDKLFSDLSLEKQESVISCTKYTLEDFRTLLSQNRDHFVKWRYYYEYQNLRVDYDFIYQLFCAIEICLNNIMEPEL